MKMENKTSTKLKKILRKIVLSFSSNLPFIKDYITKVPPGHYSSPIPSREDIIKRENQIYDNLDKKKLLDINLNTDKQIKLIEKFKKYYKAELFCDKKDEENYIRYYKDNSFFNYSDALFFHSMIRYFNPKKIIEIGSGFSSAIALDTRDKYLKNKFEVNFIEPYPDRLNSLLTRNDKEDPKIKIIVDIIQNISTKVFKQLDKNDILFIDSSHVAKLGSDVNYIFFEVLPILKKGVIIQIHDIPFPFEYHRKFFIHNGGLLNEVYFTRAFLAYNSKFEIILWPNYLAKIKENWFKINMPKVIKNKQYGGSIYLQKK